MTFDVLVKDIAIGTVGLGIDYGTGQIGHNVTDGLPPLRYLGYSGAEPRGSIPYRKDVL